MESRTRSAWAIKGAAFFLLLLLLVLYAFNHPHSDDYSYDYFLRHKGYWPASKYIYQYSGGRFFSTVLIFLSPLSAKSVVGYQLLTASLFLLFTGSIYLFSRVFAGRQYALLLSSFLFLSCCAFMPDLHEFCYWLCAEATYLAAMALLLCSFALHGLLAQKQQENNSWLWLLCGLVSILLCGCSEAGILSGIIAPALHLWYRKKAQRPDKRLYGLTILLVLLSFVIVLAPGNMHRHGQTPFAGNVLLALGGGLYTAVTLLGSWALAFAVSVAVYSTLIAPLLVERTVHLSRYFSAKVVIIAGLLFFLCCQVAAVWMSGSVPEPRFENVLFCFLLLLFLFAAQLLITEKRTTWAKVPPEHSALYRRFSLILLLAFCCASPNNFAKAITDLATGSAQQYSRETYARYDYLAQHKDSVQSVPPVNGHPQLLYYHTVSCSPVPDESDIPRSAMADYFGKKWIYEYPCSPERQDHSFKDLLKHKRKQLFSGTKQ